jgi:hypothetical protein
MEEIIYNILWIDDEHELLSATKGRAKRNGINLVAFKSLNVGMDELEKNYHKYDGVILDAKMFENEDDIPGTEDTEFVFRANDRVHHIQKAFKLFILTGQAEAFDDQTFNKAFKNVYKKGDDEDIQRLFQDVKEAASKQEDFQIRNKHKKVFECCSEKYIGVQAGRNILKLIKEKDSRDNYDHFNIIRKIIEDLFISFYKNGLLPLDFIEDRVSLNPASKFLMGKESDEEYYKEFGYIHNDETHLPKSVADKLKSILNDVQAGSHRSGIEDHLNELRSPYYFSIVLDSMLYILDWYKDYIDSNPRKENWTKIPADLSCVRTGIVRNIDPVKHFGFFVPDSGEKNSIIPPHIAKKHSLSNNMRIKVEIEDDLRAKVENGTRVKAVIEIIGEH